MKRSLCMLGILLVTQAELRAELCGAAEAGAAGASAPVFVGAVVATTNASRYTYVQIDTGKQKIWAAGPKVAVKVGDRVAVAGSMPNQNFYSQSLKKTFEEIYFVEAITPASGAGGEGARAATATGAQAGHNQVACSTARVATNGSCSAAKGMCASATPGRPHPAPQAEVGAALPAATATEVVPQPAGGKSVAEILAGSAALSGKAVVVRGKVVKVTRNVMGKTFLHLRDGTGAAGANDLVVTTKDAVTDQSVVTARGMLITDKDFGAGYKYAVMLEDATLTAK
jgi:hypothetical protein